MIQQQKRQMREHFKALRDAMTPAQRGLESAQICGHILTHPAYEQAQSILLYAAKQNEIDLMPIAYNAWAKGKTVAYPRCLDRDGHMAFFVVTSQEQLVSGSFGVWEPDQTCPIWQPDDNALCIVPALTVDAQGYRLGYGKGYYDRTLHTFGGVTACAVFQVCQVDALPHDTYDVPVQWIFDRKGAWRVEGQSQNWEKDTQETMINDDDYASEQTVPDSDEDLGEQQEDTWEPDDDTEAGGMAEGTDENVRWQRFMYRWKRIPLLGKLPFDPVMLLVLSNFALLLLSRLIDTLLVDRDNEYLVVVLLQILIY